MPAYNTLTPAPLVPLDTSYYLFNAESPTLNETSQQVKIPRQIAPVAVTIGYASAPSSTSFQVQVANEDVDANYISIGTASTNVNGDRIDIAMTTLNFKFLRVKCLTAPGVNTTVKVWA